MKRHLPTIAIVAMLLGGCAYWLKAEADCDGALVRGVVTYECIEDRP